MRATGLLALAAICYQNAAFLMGFVWASIHGAGLASVAALLPAAAAVAILCAGYVFLSKGNIKRRAALFGLHAVCILALNEIVLPETPLKSIRSQRGIDAVVVRNVRDEIFSSPQGHPLGIRIKFDAVFPRPGAYLVSPSMLTPGAGDAPYDLQFGHMAGPVIKPSPARSSEGPYPVFRDEAVYTFTYDLMPNFVSFDRRTNEPCLRLEPARFVSNADFLAALAKSSTSRYRTEIHVEGGASGTRRAVAGGYVTSREYDLRAMHEALVRHGSRCES